MLKRRIFLFLIFVLSLNFLFTAYGAQAAGATLYLSPSSGEYSIGKTFAVKVLLNSGGNGINASDGTIKFDPAFLNVSRLSDTGTIFKLWTQAPTFSNTAGTINFSGGLYGAPYKGSSGLVFTIYFSVKKAGDTKVQYTSGSVLAADGKGTDVLSSFGSATYTLTEKTEPTQSKKPNRQETKTTKETKSKGIVPPKPEISSRTHPDENVWYSNNSPEFSWKLIADLSGISFSLTEEEKDPGPESDGLVETKKFEDVEDGTWYMNLKYQNSAGWGAVAHRKVLIDSTPPVLANIYFDNNNDATDPTPVLKFDAHDETSGINKYVLNIDEQETDISVDKITNNSYKLSVLKPGDHLVTFSVFDKANNVSSSTMKLFIDPLKAPIITDMPKIIKKNKELIIRGTSFYPNATIEITFKRGKKEEVFTTITDNDNNWTYFHKGKLEKGDYEIWAKLIDNRGAESYPGTKHILSVVSPNLIEAYGIYIVVLLILLIIVLVVYILYCQNRHMEEKERIARETNEAKSRLSEIFIALRDEVDELMELADRKPGLSESEKRVKNKLQEALDISEEFISKEIDDVKKEINLHKKNK